MKILSITSVDPGWKALWHIGDGTRTSRIIALAVAEVEGKTTVVPLDTGVANVEPPQILPLEESGSPAAWILIARRP